MRRMFLSVAAVAALAVPASMAAIGVSTVAGATGPAVIKCTAMGGNISGTVTVTGKKCKPKLKPGYGNLTGNAASLATGGQLTWANADYFNVSAPTNTPISPDPKCPHGYSEEASTGTVILPTSTDAFDQSLVGGTFSSDTCIGPLGQIKLAKGSKAEF